jgi:hypothetical protein
MGAVMRSRLSAPALLPVTIASSPPPRSATCRWGQPCVMHGSATGRGWHSRQWLALVDRDWMHLHGPDAAGRDPGCQLLHGGALHAAA